MRVDRWNSSGEAYESYLAVQLVAQLVNFLKANPLGIALDSDGMMQLFHDQVCIPDASFVSWERLDDSGFPDNPVPKMAPDLAAEIISRGNTQEEMDRKLREYFIAGVRLVWYFHPKKKTVDVYTSLKKKDTLSKIDTLDGGEVLPGFAIPLQGFYSLPKKP